MSKFRTTEISDTPFESNGLRFITVKSTHLKGRGDICVFVPMGEHQHLPIVTLLHGVYGSAWIWAMKAGAHLTAQRMIDNGEIKPMILAMPSDGLWGDGSGYVSHGGVDYEKWIAEDVVDAVMELIPEASKKSTRFISGLSMGGYGALRIGAKYANQYKGISAHSSITDIDQMKLFVEEPLTAYLQKDGKDQSVFQTILAQKSKLPPLRFDCGKHDLLIAYNRNLHNQLNQHQITHTYEEFEGKHEWPYWAEHLKDTLKFFSDI
ncbi:alpha/beta hydrolase [Reichenbachiella sp.]|uniref:alpha/beta hydrolase n=1 Tax=Reichenbachiella sp. TaxID=2184521 RepID=UPI003BB204CC